MSTRTIKRVPARQQTAHEQRTAILATGDAGSVPREIVRVECPTCEGTIAPQAVIEYKRIRVGWQLVACMATYCPHCQTLILFGLPVDEATGQRLTRPTGRRRVVRRQSNIDRFLAEYPQCREVITG